MSPTAILVIAIVGGVLLIGGGLAVLIASFYRKVDQGRALIVNKMTAEPVVTFTGSVVYPIIHRAEEMDISVKTIEVARRGPDGLICKDNLRADIQVTFFVRVNKTSEDVLKVAQSVGCNRASQVEVIRELFGAKFSEALKTVGKSLDFVELYEKRAQFRDEIIAVIGQDLNGYVLEDAAIDYLEQTPLEHLDKDNILDAQGIRKITELTTAQNVQTNELKQKERMDIASQNLTADEAIFRYDQQRAEAEARKSKEIQIANARESNEAQRYTIDQQKETELSRQTANEEVKKREQDMTRGIQVAEKQRERVVAIETVEVQKAQQLKDIERERETELLRIDKEKALEKERKEIADVVRARIAVEKTVAEEEERINDLRLIAEAKRQKDAMVINAEGAAQSDLVKNIKAAEAQEEVAKFEAKELKIKPRPSAKSRTCRRPPRSDSPKVCRPRSLQRAWRTCASRKPRPPRSRRPELPKPTSPSSSSWPRPRAQSRRGSPRPASRWPTPKRTRSREKRRPTSPRRSSWRRPRAKSRLEWLPFASRKQMPPRSRRSVKPRPRRFASSWVPKRPVWPRRPQP